VERETIKSSEEGEEGMNIVIWFVLTWILSGILASTFYYLIGISVVSKSEFILTLIIGAIGGHITWLVPFLYGKENET